MTAPSQTKTILTTERFRVEEVTQTFPQGRTRTRSIVRHPGAVAILPMIDDDHICLIKNYRVSVERELVEIPAGTLEPNEPPLETARRELEEETGYQAASLEPLATFFLSPGVLDEQMYLFVARGLTPGNVARELGEEIENRITPWGEAVAMALDGRIADAKTIAGILLYDRKRGKSG